MEWKSGEGVGEKGWGMLRKIEGFPWRHFGSTLLLSWWNGKEIRFRSGVNQLTVKILPDMADPALAYCLRTRHPPELRMNPLLKRRLAQLFHELMRYFKVLVAYC